MLPYPYKVQARPPRDQRLAILCETGREGRKGDIVILKHFRSMSKRLKKRKKDKKVNLFAQVKC